MCERVKEPEYQRKDKQASVAGINRERQGAEKCGRKIRPGHVCRPTGAVEQSWYFYWGLRGVSENSETASLIKLAFQNSQVDMGVSLGGEVTC